MTLSIDAVTMIPSALLLVLFNTILGVLGNYTISTENVYTKVPYKGQTISIWKNNDNFFTFPLGFLEKTSIAMKTALDQSENKILNFNIILINEDFKKSVVNHLRKLTGKCIQIENIQMVETKDVHVTLKSRPENYLRLDKNWNISMISNPEKLNLDIPCQKNNFNVDVCEIFKTMLEGDPLLELKFNVEKSEFKLKTKSIESSELNETSVATSTEMVNCKPIEQVNMEKVIGHVETLVKIQQANMEKVIGHMGSIVNEVKMISKIHDLLNKRYENDCLFKDSLILYNDAMKWRLKRMLTEVANNSCWRRCYRASDSNFLAPTFHSKCDNKGPTVTILRVGKYVSGGYAEKSWNGKTYDIHGGKAFLFSINGNFKMNWKTGPTIHSNTDYGPIFGAHPRDLLITNKCNENTSSHYKIGQRYQLPHGYSANTARMKLIGQTGTNFKCTDYEIYYQVS